MEELKFEGLSLDRLAQITKNSAHEWQVYLAALEYMKAGYYIVPIVKNDKRLPRKEYGINYGHAARQRKTIEKWFHPDNGKFKGWNIGIACGKEDGIFAIDVDMHGDVNGFKNLERLEKENEPFPLGPCQETPNGGRHYLFQWQENGACTTNKIAPGIDTRGGDPAVCKGHIVVWPSIVNDKQYNWIEGGFLPSIPQWVMERMGVLWRPPKYGRGNENVEDEDLEKIISIKQIKDMLGHVAIDELDYDAWLKVGMAIKSQYPDDNGLALWDTWSMAGARYKDGECKIRWKGFSLEGSVRAGTLFFYAKEGGWRYDPLAPDAVAGNKFDELVARMNEEYAIVSVAGKIKILREKEAEHDTMMHYDLMDKDSFGLLLNNERIGILGANGKPKMVSVAFIWLAHEYRRTYPNGIGLYPNRASPNGYYNTWNGFSVTPRPGDCSLFLAHIKDIICCGNEEIYEWVIDWMADLIQEPDEPKGCAIVMRGGEGIGKGTLANAIGSLFGPHYRHLIDDSHLTSNFNAHLLDAIVVFADEITWGGNKKTDGKLKGMVTERNLVGERKGIDAILYRNMIHLIIASNNDWVVPAGADSRRWLVLDVNKIRANDVQYFNSIRDELDNGGREALIFMLMSREIKSNLRRALETSALQDQRAMSAQEDTLLSWWSRCLISSVIEAPDEKEFEPGQDTQENWPSYVDKVAFYDEFEAWCLKRNKRVLSLNVFLRDIKRKIGITESRVVVGGDRKRVLKIPSLNVAKEIMITKYGNMIEEDSNDTNS